LLDESDYLDDLKYDWKYTLEQWIDNERNKHLITKAELPPFLPDENFVTHKQVCDAEHINNYQQRQDTDKEKKEISASGRIDMYKSPKKYEVRRKNNNNKKIKCHFCRLEYLTNRDRTEHELAWHSKKSKHDDPLPVSLCDIRNGNANSLTNAY
jgi:hypothetical protein